MANGLPDGLLVIAECQVSDKCFDLCFSGSLSRSQQAQICFHIRVIGILPFYEFKDFNCNRWYCNGNIYIMPSVYARILCNCSTG